MMFASHSIYFYTLILSGWFPPVVYGENLMLNKIFLVNRGYDNELCDLIWIHK